MDSNRISYLFKQLEDNSLSTAEREELYSLLRSFENNDEILAWLEGSYQSTIPQPVDTNKWKPILEHILQQQPAKVIPLYKRKIFRYIAAACVILLLGIASYVILSGVEGRHKEQQAVQTHDVPAPTNTRAVITLASGQKVYLDSANNGTIAQENNVNVVKNENGDVVYNAKDAVTLSTSDKLATEGHEARTAYNTLYNPRGSKVISLTLSDGTKVWLNSESSLRYPASFASNAVSREVEITGEAYFEVAHIARPFKAGNEGEPYMPFIVKKGNTEVKVLGTHFNVNAYDDEESLKVTLLEGSVQVSAKLPGLPFGVHPDEGRTVKIKPGEQAVVTLSGVEGRNSLLTTSSVDIAAVMAWKNGFFQFDKASLQQVLRQVTRWYDVDIVYETQPQPRQFIGEMERSLSLQQVLKILEKNGVHFRIEGRKVIVMK